MKQITGCGGEQTVTVVTNGEGGAKREWNPATRVHQKASARPQPFRWLRNGRCGDDAAGTSIPHAGSIEGARNSMGGGPHASLGRRRLNRATGRIAGVILEGESKAMSGATPAGKPTGQRIAEKRRSPHRKVKGQGRRWEAKRPATAMRHTLKVTTTPRRVR